MAKMSEKMFKPFSNQIKCGVGLFVLFRGNCRARVNAENSAQCSCESV